ncbi:MAG: glucose 1-dehydrogenase [Geminicoccaceae bacterium]
MQPSFLPSFSLQGRKALVTGASRGIGEALAVGLAAFGADVAIAGRSLDRLERCRTAIEAMGRHCLAVELDVAVTRRIEPAVAMASDRLGGLDILVNNAGMEQIAPSLDVGEELWDRIVDTNLKGAFFVAQAAGRRMGKGSAILNICSLTSEVGVPTAAPYGSSKSGLLGLTRTLAVEWANRGVRVNALGPGYFRTELTETFYRDEGWQQRMLDRIPAGRFGALDDLVGAAVFLCSDAARYVTGQILYVDGGYMASI